MVNKYYIYVLVIVFPTLIHAQSDTIQPRKITNALQTIVEEVKNYKIDTSDVPHDRLTRKINELRSAKAGINIDDIIMYKINEEEEKNEKPKEITAALKKQFTSGKGKRLLDNATIWIYRQTFTYKEIKQLIHFYKTGAGKKLSRDYPVLLLKTLMATEKVHDALIAEMKNGSSNSK